MVWTDDNDYGDDDCDVDYDDGRLLPGEGVVDLRFIFMIMKALLEGLVYYEVMPTWKDLVWFRT